MFKANINDIQEALHDEKCGANYSEDGDFPPFDLDESMGEEEVKPSPKSVAYIMAHIPGYRVCNRCGEPVLLSESENYAYQCMNCDEDLYSFETSPIRCLSHEQIDRLVKNTNDILLLD